MSDLFLPIIFIVIMYVIISCVDDALTLLGIAILFFPVILVFPKVVNGGSYTELFGATIPAGTDLSLIASVMITIPIFSIARIFYIRQMIKGDKPAEALK